MKRLFYFIFLSIFLLSTGVFAANNFSGDDDVIALFTFESQDCSDSSGNGNNLIEVSTPTYPAGKEGSYCVDFADNSNESAYRTDANLSAGFPGKSGIGDIDFSVCFWLNRDESTSLEHFVDKYEYTAGNYRCFDIFTSSGSLIFKISSGTDTDSVVYDTAISTTGIWYHIGATYKASTSTLSLRVWDDNASAFLNPTTPTQTSVSSVDLAGSQSVFELATTDNGDTSEDFDGSLDEVVIFTRTLTDDEIDAIRQGAYPPSAAAYSGKGLFRGVSRGIVR